MPTSWHTRAILVSASSRAGVRRQCQTALHRRQLRHQITDFRGEVLVCVGNFCSSRIERLEIWRRRRWGTVVTRRAGDLRARLRASRQCAGIALRETASSRAYDLPMRHQGVAWRRSGDPGRCAYEGARHPRRHPPSWQYYGRTTGACPRGRPLRGRQGVSGRCGWRKLEAWSRLEMEGHEDDTVDDHGLAAFIMCSSLHSCLKFFHFGARSQVCVIGQSRGILGPRRTR